MRSTHEDAKAGNINAALRRTDGDIVVIFDADHAPTPDFLERSLGYFADPAIGFVQVMLTFENGRKSWVAGAATQSSVDFYNLAAPGMDGLRSATLVGTNALIRRTCLTSIGGLSAGTGRRSRHLDRDPCRRVAIRIRPRTARTRHRPARFARVVHSAAEMGPRRVRGVADRLPAPLPAAHLGASGYRILSA